MFVHGQLRECQHPHTSGLALASPQSGSWHSSCAQPQGGKPKALSL